MKKNISLFVLVFIICTAFNMPPMALADYRDTHTGIYSCKYYKNHLNSEAMLYVLDTGSASIVISKDPLDSILQIAIDKQIIKAKLVNQILYPHPQKGRYGGKFFSKDSISLGFASSMASSIRYMGKKK